jgi:manganese transport protein
MMARILKRVGPGLVTACVVIGPGSILTSSRVGAANGFSRVWVVLVAVVFMLVYMSLGAKLGVVTQRSAADLITQRAGRWLAVLIGLGACFISSAYQFGNNLGVHSAFDVFKGDLPLPAAWKESFWLDAALVVGFNALSITFLFAFRNLYVFIERLMSFFVALMLLAFAVNLFFAVSFVFRQDTAQLALEGSGIDLSTLGLVGTTFVITAAYYQSYLVRFKGWNLSEMQEGLVDARVGAVIMCLITLMIMSTAACVLRGKELGNVAEVAEQLYPLFGTKGKLLFCIGLFSAAYSSFLVNSMIGGFILADALGLGSHPRDWMPRILTAGVLLIGMGIGLYVIHSGVRPVAAIVAAQAVTVLAAPLMAGALWWLTSNREIMGEHRNSPLLNGLAAVGFILLLAMAWYIATQQVWPAVRDWWFT